MTATLTTTHDPIVEAYPGTRWQPAEVTVQCTADDCDWEFFSQESAGGGVEPWGDDWDEHVAVVERLENGDSES